MPSFLSKTFVGLPVYAWLIGGVVTVGAIVIFMRMKSGTPAQTNSTGTPMPGGGQPFPFPVNTPTAAPTNPSSGQLGTIPGQDAGWFYGPLPPKLGANNSILWRWSQWYIDANKAGQPWLSGQPAQGYGPGYQTPSYSWEYSIVPSNSGQGQAISTQSQQFGAAVSQ